MPQEAATTDQVTESEAQALEKSAAELEHQLNGAGAKVERMKPPEALEISNKRISEMMAQITDKALVELTTLRDDIESLMAAIQASHNHSLESNTGHTALAVDAIAAKVIMAEQVEMIRRRFKTRIGG